MHRWFLLVLVALLQLALTPGQLLAAPAAKPAAAAVCDDRMRGSWEFDGVYGPFTQMAVRQFQRDHHLTPDGVAGPQTLKALGWVPSHIVLKCGASGTTVQRLQMSLAKHDYWALGLAARLQQHPTPLPKASPKAQPSKAPTQVAVRPVTPSPRPTASARPRPTPAPATPRPSPTVCPPTPKPRPTPTPWVEPSMAPATPSPTPTAQVVVPLPPEHFVTTPAPELRPVLVEASGGTWMNTVPSGADSIFNPALPSWTYAASLWRGNWGVGGELIRFNPTGGAVTPQRFFQANTTLWGAMLKYRFDDGHTDVSAGYRVLGQSGLDFVTLGLNTRAPLLGDWLSLQARGLVGGNLSGGYTVDASTGLSLDLRPVSLGLGYRHLMVSRLRAAEPVYTLSGPTANLTIGF